MAKRIFDLVAASLGLVLLSPVLILIAIAIHFDSPGPALYRGLRAGRYGRPFRICKFRTMVTDAEKLGAASTAEDDCRITRTGTFLRKYKLDELPQLFNVIAGQMSLVGPRPQVPWAVERYSLEERKVVLGLRPGITDYASLRFRNEGEILRGSKDPDADYFRKIHPEKMRLAVEYANRQSFWLDCKILVKTVAAVVFRAPAIRADAGETAAGNPYDSKMITDSRRGFGE